MNYLRLYQEILVHILLCNGWLHGGQMCMLVILGFMGNFWLVFGLLLCLIILVGSKRRWIFWGGVFARLSSYRQRAWQPCEHHAHTHDEAHSAPQTPPRTFPATIAHPSHTYTNKSKPHPPHQSLPQQPSPHLKSNSISQHLKFSINIS